MAYQCIELVKVLYCKLLTIGEQLPTFPHRVWGLNHSPQRWEANMLPLRHHGPLIIVLRVLYMFVVMIYTMRADVSLVKTP